MVKKLLEGIRVTDITTYRTGPLTTKGLSDLGAEVIKLETRSRLRGGGGGGGGASTAALVSGLQDANGKLSITLNFASPKGLQLAYRLIAKSDIVVENHAAGTLKRRGLGYEDLKKVKPDIIMLSSCMQGQTGPYASHAAFGHQLAALSGVNQITGWPDRPPGWVGPYTDFIAPRYNLVALLTALDYRRRTGKGVFLDMAQYEAGIQFMAPLLLDYTVNKRVANRMGNRYPSAAPHNAYRCLGEDRWCAIAVFTNEEWANFCEVIGKPAMARNAKFNTLLARKENEEELDRLVNEWTGSRTAEDVMSKMQAAGIAAAVVETAEDQMDKDPQLKHRGFFKEVERPGGGGTYRAWPGAHFLLSKTPFDMKRAPIVGEHNDYVFKGILGLSDEEMAELAKEKVID
ncbi:MAG: CoA transferase [Chloroflexi bacterium]|nr:CoA transferase [Chloroflexota bacterium]